MQQAHMQPQNEPQAEAKKKCLTDLTLPKLTDYIKSIGQPAFRAKQIFKWIHQKQATDFSAMTDQPKALLAQFAQNCTLAVPTIRRRQQSKDGTVKYLLQLAITATLYVYPHRWAALWGAAFVPPPRRAACGT